ncbi:hypothetical protein BZA77DRAFT_161499 [Pyronema omphalodes]|nr:hypothetical protein BZA77DRAFT_161499 [Pyronema omphalodes]
MDPSAFHVVYIDRRAKRDRVETRSDNTISNGVHEEEEHWNVQQNVNVLLRSFSSVSICSSAQSCVSILSEVNSSDLNPILLLLDVPVQPHPEEDNSSSDGRHDSGIAASPADIIGLPLLKFITAEIENTRLSNLIVPVALLTNDEQSNEEASEELPTRSSRGTRDMQCIDNGAWDVMKCPLSTECAKALRLHCYRAKRTVYKTRKRSWVGVDEAKNDNYSYLREKMVRELMTEICSPAKRVKVSTPTAGRIRVPKNRAEVARRAVGGWDFSAHDFSDDELVFCAQTMFEHAFTMPEVADYVISSDRLVDFLMACRSSYNDQVPYHNFRHVVDVLQAIFYFMLSLGVLPAYGGVDNTSQHPDSLSHIITPLDALTLLIVAIGHDVGHPGVNNAFLVTLKAPLAQLYNDKSVLESFHCAAFSQVLLNHWPKTTAVRKMMIDMILATDMGLHFDFMGKLDKLQRKYAKDGGFDTWDDKAITDYRTLLCALLIKCADISNVARKHECSAQWARILIDEFARQANMESDLGIPSSLVAPPVTGSVIALAKSQVGFMNLFAIPLFENLSKVLPEMSFSVTELVANKESWSEKIQLYSEPPKESVGGQQRPIQSSHSTMTQTDQRGKQVLGTVMMDSDMPRSDANTSTGMSSPKSDRSRPGTYQRAQSANGNATAVTVVVTHPKKSTSRTNGLAPGSEKRPTYQHSTEHLRAGAPEASDAPGRPRSSPPDLGDCSDHSCSKGCCNATAVVTGGAMERRSSRFFKKVKIWKGWRKEPNDG